MNAAIRFGLSAFTLLAFLFIASSAQAFNFISPKFNWPGKPAVIKYHTNVKPYAWSIKQAVNAWNKSGVKVKFKKVSSAKKAKLVIRQWKHKEPVNSCVGRGDLLGVATTQLKYTRSGKLKPTKSKVELNNYKGNPQQCRFVMAQVATHELGHVLGLDHENKNCAIMSPATMVAQGSWPPSSMPNTCKAPAEPAWWCKLLGKDDLRGAQKLYGGQLRLRQPEYCPFLAPPPPLENISAGELEEEGLIDDGGRFEFVGP
jgi:hypothetical protein